MKNNKKIPKGCQGKVPQFVYKERVIEILQNDYDISYDDYIRRLSDIDDIRNDNFESPYSALSALLGVFYENYKNIYEDFNEDYDGNCIDNLEFYLQEWFNDNNTDIEYPKCATNEELVCLGLYNFLSSSPRMIEIEEYDYDANEEKMVEYDICTLDIYSNLGDAPKSSFVEACYCDENNSFTHSNGEYVDRICERCF